MPNILGLLYRHEYVDKPYEKHLTAAIDSESWDLSWERRRQLYGTSYGPAEGTQRPIPDWGLELVKRMHAEGISERPFDQMLINEYLPGQGIALHGDYTPFDRTIVSLSLLLPCIMDFRHVPDGRRKSLLLPPRSLLILNDEARYDWQHGIARRKTDRYGGILFRRSSRLSITFRLRRR